MMNLSMRCMMQRSKRSKKIPTIQAPFLKRNRKYPKYSILHHAEGWQSKSQGHHPNSPCDHYRQEFYNAVDVLLSSVCDHFDQPSFLVFEKLESLLVKVLKSEDFSCELEFVGAKYDADIGGRPNRGAISFKVAA